MTKNPLDHMFATKTQLLRFIEEAEKAYNALYRINDEVYHSLKLKTLTELSQGIAKAKDVISFLELRRFVPVHPCCMMFTGSVSEKQRFVDKLIDLGYQIKDNQNIDNGIYITCEHVYGKSYISFSKSQRTWTDEKEPVWIKWCGDNEIAFLYTAAIQLYDDYHQLFTDGKKYFKCYGFYMDKIHHPFDDTQYHKATLDEIFERCK